MLTFNKHLAEPATRPNDFVGAPQNPHVFPYTFRFRGPAPPRPWVARDGSARDLFGTLRPQFGFSPRFLAPLPKVEREKIQVKSER